jgi:flagellar protein FlaI
MDEDETKDKDRAIGGFLGEVLERREEEYHYLRALDEITRLAEEEGVRVLKTGRRYKIVLREGEKLPTYLVLVPPLTRKERRVLRNIEKRAIAEIAIDPESILDTAKRRRIFLKEVMALIDAYYPGLNPEKRRSFAELVVQNMIGLGMLEPLLEDDGLEEVMVLGVRKRVYVYHRKFGMCRTNLMFEEEEDIVNLITKIARSIGRRIDASMPMLDARLPDGSRVNATIPPVSLDGPSLTIRKFRVSPYTIVDLVDFGTLSPEVAAFLWLVVEGFGAKPANLLISGGTSSGKTTTLNCLGSFIPASDRVVTIEDTAELRLPVEHWVRLETRPPNIEGKGEITMDVLLKNALRMRPDRIVVGEVRGREANTLVAAMNTGHDGSLGTVHANSARETITRLTNPPMGVPMVMLPSLDIILMQNKFTYDGKMVRRITEIAEIRGMRDGDVDLSVIYAWDPRDDTVKPTGRSMLALRKIAALKGVSLEDIQEEIDRRAKVIEYMVRKGLRRIKEVGEVVNEYYIDPDAMLRKVDEGVIEAPVPRETLLEEGERYRIVKRDDELTPLYIVPVPDLSYADRELLPEVEANIISEIELDPTAIRDREKAEKLLTRRILEVIRDKYPEISPSTRKAFARVIVPNMLGYGFLDYLLMDDELEEVMVVGVDRPVYVHHREYGACRTNIVFKEDREILRIIEKVARSVGRRIDRAVPLMDARLPDGSRVNATIPPVSLNGPTLTIRKFRKKPLTVVNLIEYGTLTPEVAAYLWLGVEGLGIKPCNILAAGGSSSGKTTTLNCLASFIPSTERVITIEDTAELQLPIEHTIRLETRLPNIEGEGEITMDDLVKNALRMRPDRIIVGEVRGVEARTLFTAMNTGHDGCMSTIHANSARETITRLTNPPMNVPPVMLPALDVILMQDRVLRDGRILRRITEIAEVVKTGRGKIRLRNLYEWNPRSDALEMKAKTSVVKRELARLRGVSREDVEIDLRRREEILRWMLRKGIKDLEGVAEVFESYHTAPEKLMRKIRGDAGE